MPENWRLLRTGFQSAYENMGTDESIMVHRSQGKVPNTIRLYGWRPPAVSIGYFQGIQDEVDLQRCEELGVDVVRRITGGGAVFHDAEVTYSVVVDKGRVPGKVLDSYRLICNGLVRGFRKLGVETEFAPLNDIIVKESGKKISGNAQTRRMGVVLQHGTILLSVNPKKMFSLLRVPDEKLRDKMIKAAEERVTSINDVCCRANFDEVCDAMVKGFESSLGIKLEEGELTKSEGHMSKELANNKYKVEGWNFKR
jgi:lipoate-protein ligase A